MSTILRIDSPADSTKFGAMPGATPDTTAEIRRDGADEHWMVVDAHGDPLARCSLWWKDTPPLPGYRVGIVGHYAASDHAAARALLYTACERLADEGCTLAVGPMDGSTWRRYRFVTDRCHFPPFFLDVDNPDEWPLHFAECGFATLARYASSLIPDTARAGTVARHGPAIGVEGVTLRPIDDARPEDDLRRIYRLSLEAFRENFLYAPITEDEFLARYRPVLGLVRRELVLCAERGGELVGFVFCVPDQSQAARRRVVDTVVLKTFAVHPQLRGRGMGTALVAESCRAARSLGYTKMIIAFMHEDNPSMRISEKHANVIRRYALFSREL
jgi:GNAT superfamily N-acetyltransferase